MSKQSKNKTPTTIPNTPKPQPSVVKKKTVDDSIWFPGFVAEVYMSFLFWSMISQFPSTIWFFPVEDLRVSDSGEEIFYLVAFLSPIILTFDFVKNLVIRFRSFFLVLLLAFFPSYYYTNENLSRRSLIHSIGLGFGQLGILVNFWRSDSRKREAGYTLLLGLLLFLFSRFYFKSYTPLFFNWYLSLFLCIVGAVACVVLLFESNNFAKKKKSTSCLSSIKNGVGFGSLLFLTLWLVSEYGVFARWLDLDPVLYGFGFFAAFITGILISQFESITGSIFWKAIGVASAPLIIFLPEDSRVYATYLFVLYIVSIWVNTVQKVGSGTNAGITLFVAYIFYVVGLLAVVWSVAFPFVPIFGKEMRETFRQTLYVFTGLTLLTHQVSQKKQSNSLPPKKALWVLLLISLFVLVPAILTRAPHYRNFDSHGIPKDNIKAMMWAIRFSYDNKGWNSIDRVVEKLRHMEANVIGLVETDASRLMNGNWDPIEYIAEELHMYSDFGPNTMNETWGCALLSAYPIVRSERVALPSPIGEIACLIDATLNVNGENVDVIVTHFGNHEHYEDRFLQTQDSAQRAALKKKNGKKAIWLGYLTDKPGSKYYNMMIEGGWTDVVPNEMDRWCLYHFHIGLKPFNFTRHSVGKVSDTEIQSSYYKVK